MYRTGEWYYGIKNPVWEHSDGRNGFMEFNNLRRSILAKLGKSWRQSKGNKSFSLIEVTIGAVARNNQIESMINLRYERGAAVTMPPRRSPVKEPPNEPQKPPVEEPGKSPVEPPPGNPPPVEEPPNDPKGPPVKEPPPENPDPKVPERPPMRVAAC